MFRLTFCRVVSGSLLLLTAGCSSARRTTTESRGDQPPPPKPLAAPTAEQVQAAAPALARTVSNWRAKTHAGGRILARGPTFVGIEGVTAKDVASLGALLGDAINRQADPNVRFVPAEAGAVAEPQAADTVLDARAAWEPRGAAVADGKRRPRLVLELVDPLSGRTVVTADSGALPAAPILALATAQPARPKPVEDGQRPSSTGDAPARVAAGATSAAPPRRTAPRAEGTAVASPAPGDSAAAHDRRANGAAVPSPERDSSVSGPVAEPSRPLSGLSPPPATPRDRRRTPTVTPLSHGVVYFESAKLADRVAILQERIATSPDGQISVRLVLTCRKGKRSLELRCEFYDDQGLPAGTVGDVELEIREGRPDTISLASRKLAVRYVLFVRD